MKNSYEIGMVGLGVMGRNLLLNMADHNFSVAGFDKDLAKVESLRTEAGQRSIQATKNVQEFIQCLKTPRAIMILVPAGNPVDSVIAELRPLLTSGDIIIDGGNSYFKDTDRREKELASTGIHFVGMGVSGGESGARHGPSLMPGGNPQAYERIRPILEAISAQVQNQPCVSHIGAGSSGHYVKMVHNGIEYGVCELIAETYDLMHRGLHLKNEEIQATYAAWNQSELEGYLVEITAHIFSKIDEKTGKHLIDFILDAAKQKGTGKWTSQNAMDLNAPTNTIDTAVAWRSLSALKEEREAASMKLSGPKGPFRGDKQVFLSQLKNAFYTGMIITYAQGMAELYTASKAYSYNLNLEKIAQVWRGGCIIRAALLNRIRESYHATPDLPNLLLDSNFGKEINSRQQDLRSIIKTGIELGIPVPSLMASLAYFDGYRSVRLPANLIQAQRDYFGAHSYERIDQIGTFHTHWN